MSQVCLQLKTRLSKAIRLKLVCRWKITRKRKSSSSTLNAFGHLRHQTLLVFLQYIICRPWNKMFWIQLQSQTLSQVSVKKAQFISEWSKPHHARNVFLQFVNPSGLLRNATGVKHHPFSMLMKPDLGTQCTNVQISQNEKNNPKTKEQKIAVTPGHKYFHCFQEQRDLFLWCERQSEDWNHFTVYLAPLWEFSQESPEKSFQH